MLVVIETKTFPRDGSSVGPKAMAQALLGSFGAPALAFHFDEWRRAIAVDSDSGALYVGYNTKGAYVMHRLHVRDVVEAVVDSRAVSTQSKAGFSGTGALGGALFFGLPGALFGSLLGERVQTERLNDVQLNLVLKCPDYPLHTVSFAAGLSHLTGFAKNQIQHQKFLAEANRYRALILAAQ